MSGRHGDFPQVKSVRSQKIKIIYIKAPRGLRATKQYIVEEWRLTHMIKIVDTLLSRQLSWYGLELVYVYRVSPSMNTI